MNKIILTYAFNYVVNAPINILVSDHSILKKSLAGLAIGIFSILSLGAYVVHTYCALSNYKVVWLQKELENAVKDKKHEVVQKLLEKNPILKKNINISFYLSDNFSLNGDRISQLLHIASATDDVKMMEILFNNGADINLESFRGAEDKPIDVAVEHCNTEALQWLFDHGATLHERSLFSALNKKQNKGHLNFDFLFSLLQKNMSFKFWDFGIDKSLFCVVAGHYNENPEKCKELLALMLEKGAGECLLPDYEDILTLNKDAEKYMTEEQKQIVQPIVLQLLK